MNKNLTQSQEILLNLNIKKLSFDQIIKVCSLSEETGKMIIQSLINDRMVIKEEKYEITAKGIVYLLENNFITSNIEFKENSHKNRAVCLMYDEYLDNKKSIEKRLNQSIDFIDFLGIFDEECKDEDQMILASHANLFVSRKPKTNVKK